MTLSIAPFLLTGFLLASVRAAAFLMVSPPFDSQLIPQRVKAGLAMSLGLVAGPHLAESQVPIEVGPLIAAGAFQIGLGVTLGFLVKLLFAAVQSAGEMIDVFGGIAVQPSFDPLSNSQASGFGRIYQVFATTLLFAIGGHVLLVRGFLESFEAVGVGGIEMATVQSLVVGNFLHFVVAAVEIAAPLLAVTFLLELGQGLVARAAPQMNVFLAVMPLKILMALVLIAIALPLLPGAVSSLVDNGVSDMVRLARS
ncbi:MAG: flagellar biosynthetic protein FliR [Actinomycetota bacterium]|jgi:flagellar biosynthetic protein FliR|uniref:flagellar biosynthetic protein FliR n=1 Tax=Euzebya pacifica TaxID=1608957 RepID=UPI0030FD17F1